MRQDMTEEKNTIITSKEIQDILTNYKIGKKPLARLLGWGETTIIRYMDGDVPTIEYSDKLKAIFKSPGYYYKILMKNQRNLTNVAFKKSKRAVLAKLMESRINVIAQYIINLHGGQMCQQYLQKLLYYTQGFHLALYDAPLFEEEYTITENNMPYIKLYQEMEYSNAVCVELGCDLITEEEREIVDVVVDAFGWYGPKTLSTMISFEKTLLKVSRDKDNNKVVTNDSLKLYFKDVIMEYRIANPKEIAKYPDSRFADLKN